MGGVLVDHEQSVLILNDPVCVESAADDDPVRLGLRIKKVIKYALLFIGHTPVRGAHCLCGFSRRLIAVRSLYA